MTDYVEYTPPANGVAPRGWQEGMVWRYDGLAPRSIPNNNPYWETSHTYHIPTAALHYPIVPYEEKWGADIAVEGRPEWLSDEQPCKPCWNGVTWRTWSYSDASDVEGWDRVTKIRLPASHGYYADNPASDESAPNSLYCSSDVTEWLRANLPAIEAAGHSVTFAPDLAMQLFCDVVKIANWGEPTEGVLDKKDRAAIALIRSRVRPVL